MDLTGITIGPYRLIRRLGTGGMAEVYEAHQPALNRSVALKMLLPHLATDPAAMQRFLQEGQAAARLNHPNIVPVYDVGVHNGRYYLVMQLLDGEDLACVLSRVGRLVPAQAYSIIAQVASALDYAHQCGVVHRDVKPSNIFMSGSGHATLTDFGAAKLQENLSLSRSGEPVGTPLYMAPEQALGQAVGSATDHYALGVVLYEMLSGRPPFNASTAPALLYQVVYQSVPPVRSLAPELPPQIEPLVARALAKDPRDRFQTGEELTRALTAVLLQAPAGRTGSGDLQRTPTSIPIPLRPTQLWVLAPVLAFLVLLIAVASGSDTGTTVSPAGNPHESIAASTPTHAPIKPGVYAVGQSAAADIHPHGSYILTVDRVVVQQDGKWVMYVVWLWKPAASEEPGMSITKQSDDGNRNMYLTDDTGTRYDHEQVGGAAAVRTELPRNREVQGWFRFPAPLARARVFQFHDDDNQLIIAPIRLTP